MFVAALDIELHLPECLTLKQKRAVVKPLVEGARRRFHVAVAEVDHHDTWQRTAIGVAVVGRTPAHCDDVLDEVERFVWSFPEVQVLSITRRWMEQE